MKLHRTLLPFLILPLLAACATLSPEQQACEKRMEALADRLMPGFEKLGYKPRVAIRIDEKLANGRGFPSPSRVVGDSSPGGGIRLRPVVCSNDGLASIVVAHEMSHVALAHWTASSSSAVLAWEASPRELEADALARRVLEVSGAPKQLLDFLSCRLGQCQKVPSGLTHKPVGTKKDESL